MTSKIIWKDQLFKNSFKKNKSKTKRIRIYPEMENYYEVLERYVVVINNQKDLSTAEYRIQERCLDGIKGSTIWSIKYIMFTKVGVVQ